MAVVPENAPLLWSTVVPPLMSTLPVVGCGLNTVQVFWPDRVKFTVPPMLPAHERAVLSRFVIRLPLPMTWPSAPTEASGTEEFVRSPCTNCVLPFMSRMPPGPTRTKEFCAMALFVPRRSVPPRMLWVPVMPMLAVVLAMPWALAGEFRMSRPASAFTSPAVPVRVLFRFSVEPLSTW